MNRNGKLYIYIQVFTYQSTTKSYDVICCAKQTQETDENCKHLHSFCEWFVQSILRFKNEMVPLQCKLKLRWTQTNSLNQKAWLCLIWAPGQLKENALTTDKASQHKCPNPHQPSALLQKGPMTAINPHFSPFSPIILGISWHERSWKSSWGTRNS